MNFPDPTRPRVQFDARTLVCQRHEWALAADRTVNSLAFPIEIFQSAAADERAQKAARAGEDGDIERLNAFLVSVAPVCEWLPAEVVAACWQKARELGRAVAS